MSSQRQTRKKKNCWCQWLLRVWLGESELHQSGQSVTTNTGTDFWLLWENRTAYWLFTALRIWLIEMVWWMSWHICDHYFGTLWKSIVFALPKAVISMAALFTSLLVKIRSTIQCRLMNELPGQTPQLGCTRVSNNLQMSLWLSSIHIPFTLHLINNR